LFKEKAMGGDFVVWGIIIGTILLLVVNAYWVPKKVNEKFCTSCGVTGPGAENMKGSIVLEIFLWCLMILPGLLYSIWRHTTIGEVCASCGAPNLIPPDSPVARKMRAELEQKVAPQVIRQHRAT
jgi:hypothetical protein